MEVSLIDSASILLNDRYVPGIHTAAAALRASDGSVFTALNIDHFSGFVCAETAALSAAINDGYYEFDEVVAVIKNSSGTIEIANMCGKCRQIFHDYAPGIKVQLMNGDSRPIEEILPKTFTKQREKIKSALELTR